MLLKVTIADDTYGIEITEELLTEGGTFFERMDRDMDNGWQMSRYWVENPDALQRCQIAAHKLARAIQIEDKPTLMMMAGYILSRMPGVESVIIDLSGDMTETEFRGTRSDG